MRSRRVAGPRPRAHRQPPRRLEWMRRIKSVWLELLCALRSASGVTAGLSYQAP